jgi:hypothetical protein
MAYQGLVCKLPTPGVYRTMVHQLTGMLRAVAHIATDDNHIVEVGIVMGSRVVMDNSCNVANSAIIVHTGPNHSLAATVVSQFVEAWNK